MNPPQPPRKPAPKPLKPMVRKSVGSKKAAPEKPKGPAKPAGPGLWARIPRKLKIAAAVVAALPVLLLLYTAVRAMQYAAAGGPAASRLPADADIVVVAPDFAATFARWRETGAWEAIQRRILRDPYVRENLNAALEEAGLPTLDQLDDDRFVNSPEGAMYDPDRLLDLFGRDVAFAAREDGRFVVVTRMSFGQFWAAPFAALHPSIEGDPVGLRVELGEGRSLWVATDGDLAMIADDPGLLASARAGGYAVRPGDAAPVVAEVRFGTPAAAEPFDDFIHSFPVGIFGHFIDLKGATGARLTFDLDGATLKGDVEVIGGRAVGGGGDSLALLPLVPEGTAQHGTFYVQPTTARGRELWEWLNRAVFGEGSGAVLGWASGDLAFTIKEATKHGFDTDVLPLLDGPSLIAFGHVPTKHPRARGEPMLVGAVLFRSSRAEEVEEKIDAIIDKILGSELWKDKQAVVEKLQERDATLRIVRGSPAYEPLYFVTPCFARIGDVVVIATHDEFLRGIVDARAGARPRFIESGWWQEFRRSLEPAGLGDVLEPGSLSGGVVHLDLFRSSSLVFIAPMVEYTVKGDKSQTEIRNRITRSYQGRPVTPDQITAEVRAEMDRLIAKNAGDIRRQIEVLRWFGTLGVRAESTQDGVRARWAMQLYRE